MSKLKEEDIERWITVNGNHIPIKKGETEEDAIKRFTDYVDNATGKKKKKDTEEVDDKLVKSINPNFKEDTHFYDSAGFNNNCAKCALAFEMAMRGEDVEANEFKFGYLGEADKSKHVYKAFGLSQGAGWSVREKKKAMSLLRFNQIMEDQFEDGDRGIIKAYSFDKSNGVTIQHVMNVVKQNGHNIIVDAQAGKQEDITNVKTSKRLAQFGGVIDIYKVSDKPIDKEYAEWAYKKRK